MNAAYQPAIASKGGCIAKDWIIEYHLATATDAVVEPYTFFTSKIGAVHDLDSATLSAIKTRFFMYLGLIQIAQGNQTYKAIQDQLMDELAQAGSRGIPWNQASIACNGKSYFFWFNQNWVVLQLPSAKVTLELHTALVKRYSQLTRTDNTVLIFDSENNNCCYFQIAICNAFPST